MRVARPLVAVASMTVLAGFGTGAVAASPVTGDAAARSAPVVVIRPGIVHLHSALKAPPSTQFCEQHFKIAC